MLDAPKLKFLKLENIACFERLELEFSSKVNFFIGRNSTGKSVILKLLYSVFSALSLIGNEINNKDGLEEELGKKLSRVFQVEKVGRLVRRSKGNKRGVVLLQTSSFSLEFSFSRESKKVQIKKGVKVGDLKLETTPIFIPPKEVLSYAKGLVQVYKEREFEIEEVYPDLANFLQLPLRRGASSLDRKVGEALQSLGIERVRLERDGRFYLRVREPSQLGTSDLEAPLVAEGLRKLATIYVLVKNGVLRRGAFLFWDEPEVNINPSATKLLINLIKAFSSEGIQVLVATHDYFVLKYADMLLKEKKFFSLFWGREGVEAEAGDSIYSLEHNDILNEFEEIYKVEFQGDV